MSDNLLRLIPDTPEYIPSAARVAMAISILSRISRAVIVDAQEYPEVRFIDQGGNFETISCPCCESQLDLIWWEQAMDKASQVQFADLTVITPCCGCATNLNDIRYHWPAGFARFCITIGNPPPDLKPATLKRLSNVLATPLRKVWVHC